MTDFIARPSAIIFDFDGVLIESEFTSNRHLSDLLTEFGRPTSIKETLTRFSGLAGRDFAAALERYFGAPIPAEFEDRRRDGMRAALVEGVGPVTGAVEFVRSLPADLPRAVASSSSVRWIETHLQHVGLAGAFGAHLYSGSEHVDRGKPEPDLYLHAACRLQVPIADCVIIEDSEVGATGALASGATVIGLVAGTHCVEGHADRLREIGVQHIAESFQDVRKQLRL
jgi:beta-phosphoglucomutase-like phosphatase (HAD superfamily)